jgi:hypothetical protein
LERVQAASGEKVATPLEAQVIMPEGEAPVTLAVHVVREPTGTGDGAQLALTSGVALEAFTTMLPELEGLLVSPA